MNSNLLLFQGVAVNQTTSVEIWAKRCVFILIEMFLVRCREECELWDIVLIYQQPFGMMCFIKVNLELD